MKLNIIDRAIGFFDPQAGLERATARQNLTALAGYHEATRRSKNRRGWREAPGPNSVVGSDAVALRTAARELERDLDIGCNVLNVLEQHVVGVGIGVEPAPRLPGQPVNVELKQQLTDFWGDFWVNPEVTQSMDYGKAQRILCRTWMRDGEALYQRIRGIVPGLNHISEIPYSIELIRADQLPFDLNDIDELISQGVECNEWGAAVAYHLLKTDITESRFSLRRETKRIPADRIGHIALVQDIGQRRGISVFASIINRLADIRDYEDAERIAAKVAASMTVAIKKGDPQSYGNAIPGGSATTLTQRDISMQPGLFIDDLLPGESLEVINSNRPNVNAVTWREGQLRAVSGGARVSNSSLTKNYNGTYSAQRQELVEQYGAYAMLSEEMVNRVVRVSYRDLVEVAVLSGRIKLPKGWKLRHLQAASYMRPEMPWIDPLKEAKGFEVLDEHGWISAQEVIRRRGGRPDDVLEQRDAWNQRLQQIGNASPTKPNKEPES